MANTIKFTADATTPVLLGDEDNGILNSGTYLFGVQGTFGSGTVTLVWSVDGGTTWTAVGSSTTIATNPSSAVFSAAKEGFLFGVKLTGSTSPSLSVGIGRVQALK